MKKTIKYDKKYLTEIGYRGAPITQIFGLKLKPLEQLVLLNMFGHKDTYQISINNIANCFGTKKNRSDIADAIKKLVTLGYLQETDTTYIVSLLNIYNDYKKAKTDRTANISGDSKTDSNPESSEDSKTDSSAIIDRIATIDSSANLPDSKPISQVIVPLKGTDSSANNQVIGLLTKSDSFATSNNIILKENIKLLSNKLLNNEEDKPKNLPLDSDTSSDLNKFLPSSNNSDYSILIDNDYENLSSVYFSQLTNEKILKEYLHQTDEIKSELTCHQFEKMFLCVILNKYKFNYDQKNPNFSRPEIVNLFNNEFDTLYQFFSRNLITKLIQSFKDNEERLTKLISMFRR